MLCNNTSSLFNSSSDAATAAANVVTLSLAIYRQLENSGRKSYTQLQPDESIPQRVLNDL
jgi:hypothetical protein